MLLVCVARSMVDVDLELDLSVNSISNLPNQFQFRLLKQTKPAIDKPALPRERDFQHHPPHPIEHQQQVDNAAESLQKARA